MDDHDDGITPMLKLDLELEFEGPNDATLNKCAADTLRLLTASKKTNSTAVTTPSRTRSARRLVRFISTIPGLMADTTGLSLLAGTIPA
jgi:hypothetical protein